MADILHDFPIATDAHRVFEAISAPKGLDHWWTQTSSGSPREGAEYELRFGPGYDWRARVSRYVPDREFELEFTEAMDDWRGTRVNFELIPNGASTQLRFRHTGWPATSEHYRITCFCWAMYLRVMRRWLEHGEEVEYERRLDV